MASRTKSAAQAGRAVARAHACLKCSFFVVPCEAHSDPLAELETLRARLDKAERELANLKKQKGGAR